MPKYIRQAEKFMVAHLTEPIGAADVAAAVGIPVRTLYHAFKQFRGQPPLAWLRTQRLRSARQDILEARNPDVTVTDLATLYCCSSIGRFASAYRKAFGELPSETLRKKKNDDP